MTQKTGTPADRPGSLPDSRTSLPPDASAPSINSGQALRRRAEDRLNEKQSGQKSEVGGPRAPEETARLLHELRVHQIELEMQNEELRRAQTEIEAGRARYFDLYDLAPVGYCTLSEQGLILEANLTVATLLGTARGALVKRSLSHFIIKEDQDVYYLHRKKLFETGEPQECELRLVKAEGTNFWAHLAATAAQADDGAPVCRVVLIDITERKRTEKDLFAMAERYRLASRASNDVVWDWDIVNDAQRWNESGTAVFGWTDIVNAPQPAAWWVERVHPEDRPRVEEAFFAAVRDPALDRWHDEYRFRKANGAYAYVVDRGHILRDATGRAVRVIGAMLDITERKLAEESRRESEANLRALLAATTQSVLLLDVHGTVIEINEIGAQRLGRRREEVLGTSAYGHLPPEMVAPRRTRLAEVVSGGQPVRFEDTRAGRVLDQNLVPIFNEAGQVVRVAVFAEDITERKRGEAALLEREEQLRSIASSIPGAIYQFVRRVDGTFEIPFMSEGARLLFGRPVAELQNSTHLFDDVHPEDVPGLWSSIEASAKGLTPWSTEFRLVPKTAPHRWLRGASNPQRMPDGGISWYGVLLDITEQKRGEEQTRLQHTLALALAAASDLQQGLRLCLQAALQGSGLDAGGFYLLEESSGALDFLVHQGLSPDFVEAASHFEAHSDQARLIMAGLPAYAGLEDLGLSLSEAERREGLRFVAVIPLRHEGAVIGCMNVASRSVDDIPPANRQVLETIAATATQAIVRLQAEEELRNAERHLRSTLDGLSAHIAVLDDRGEIILTNKSYRDFAELNGGEPSAVSEGTNYLAVCDTVSGAHSEEAKPFAKGIRDVLSGNRPSFELEYPCHSPDAQRWFIARVTPFAGGGPLGVVVAHEDITERKRAQEEATRSAALLRDVVDMVPAYICAKNSEGRFLLVNRKLADFYGLPVDTMTGMLHAELCEDEEELRAMLAADRQVIESGRAEVIPEETMKMPDGSSAVLETYKIPFAADGKPAVLIAAADITERKRAQEALRASEARFRSYVEHAPYGVFVTDGQGRYVDVNPAAERISGYSVAQLTSMGIPDLLTSENRESGLDLFQTLVATGRLSTELGFRRADGSLRCWSVCATQIGPDRYLGFVEDITERKEREVRMDLLVRMLDDAPAAITIHDTNGQFIFSNRENILLHGYATEKEFLSVNLHDLDMPESEALLAERFQQIALRGEARFEVAHYRKDGSSFSMEVTAKAIEWHGRPAVLSIASDITERKQAQEALKASDLRFKQLLLNVATVAVQGYALDGTVRYWNRASETFYGYTAEEALSQNLLDLIIPPALHDGVRAAIRRMVETGEAIPAAEVELMRKDGSTIPVYSSHVLVELPGQDPELFCIDIDLTERKHAEAEQAKLQAQFIQAQKMESVGRLAGGVAHDFNNLLMGIMNYTELCRDGVAPEHPIRPWLDEITTEARRSANLVRQLLAFARKQLVQPKVLDLNEQIGGMLKMLGRLIGEHIELSWSPGATLRLVRADPSHIDQVMANLCVNAADAIAGNGRIAITTRNVTMDETACAGLPGMVPGAYVLLTVADTGCGMDADTLAHAFEPFFTTKGVGHGTGLGLATVYGIVKQSDGFVYVDSAPGAGATFRIYLPALDCAETEAEPLADVGPPPGGSETILVVDDERSIRVTTAAHLERLGYNVLMADGPEAVLRLAREHTGALDLLLSDVVMPGMSGIELRERLLLAHPDLKTIFITGHTTADFGDLNGKGPDVVRLTKPVPLRDLALAIRAVLGDRTAKAT